MSPNRNPSARDASSYPIVVGRYRGKPEAREGQDEALSPTERKTMAKAEAIPLELFEDGRYEHRGCLDGTWEEAPGGVLFKPARFMGKTRQEQEEACAERGSAFRFAFVFDQWRLLRCADGLETPPDGSPVRTLYRPAK